MSSGTHFLKRIMNLPGEQHNPAVVRRRYTLPSFISALGAVLEICAPCLTVKMTVRITTPYLTNALGRRLGSSLRERFVILSSMN